MSMPSAFSRSGVVSVRGRGPLLVLALFAAASTVTLHSQKPSSLTRPDLEGTWRLSPGLGTPRLATNPPFQPWAEQFFKEAQSGERPDPGAWCLAPGVPRIMKAPYPFEIFQRNNRVDLLHEYQHIVRRIWTDGREHPKDLDPTWMGHSIGRYEGDTLVVDTVGLNDRTWLDPGGAPHSDQLHVVERFRRVGPERLNVEITIDDLNVYTKVWSVLLTYDLKPDWEIYEYICEENNRAQPKDKPRP